MAAVTDGVCVFVSCRKRACQPHDPLSFGCMQSSSFSHLPLANAVYPSTPGTEKEKGRKKKEDTRQRQKKRKTRSKGDRCCYCCGWQSALLSIGRVIGTISPTHGGQEGRRPVACQFFHLGGRSHICLPFLFFSSFVAGAGGRAFYLQSLRSGPLLCFSISLRAFLFLFLFLSYCFHRLSQRSCLWGTCSSPTARMAFSTARRSGYSSG